MTTYERLERVAADPGVPEEWVEQYITEARDELLIDRDEMSRLRTILYSRLSRD